MIKTLNNIDNKTNEMIKKCKSDSKVCGKDLRIAHYYLGQQLGKQIVEDECLINNKIAIVVMMRAGLPFSLGLVDELENKNNVDIYFSNSIDDSYKQHDTLIICDAVINTGKTVLNLYNNLEVERIIIASNVVSDKSIDIFEKYNLYTVRISTNSYKGTHDKTIKDGKGPDTGDRLFSNHFFD